MLRVSLFVNVVLYRHTRGAGDDGRGSQGGSEGPRPYQGVSYRPPEGLPAFDVKARKAGAGVDGFRAPGMYIDRWHSGNAVYMYIYYRYYIDSEFTCDMALSFGV